jgi:hypothetical protein
MLDAKLLCVRFVKKIFEAVNIACGARSLVQAFSLRDNSQISPWGN